jgi:TrmH family RNA methyltransferase
MSIFVRKMLSNNRKKELISLKQKKYRQRYGQFLVEGEKSVMELCKSDYNIDVILVTSALFPKFKNELISFNVLIINEKDMQSISNLETSPGIIAVSNFKETDTQQWTGKQKFTLMLDGISDPGNLGTIIRIADWYGIETILCSPDCVDLYNPKTIASSMGSFTRVNVIYTELEKLLNEKKVNSFACVMQGKSIQDFKNIKEGIIIIGNEARGISPALIKMADNQVTIPRVGKAESLNAAIATALVCHKFILG